MRQDERERLMAEIAELLTTRTVQMADGTMTNDVFRLHRPCLHPTGAARGLRRPADESIETAIRGASDFSRPPGRKRRIGCSGSG